MKQGSRMDDAKRRHFENVPILWEPDKNSGKKLKEFMKFIADKYKADLKDYWDFHKWSLDHIEEFWAEIWTFSRVIFSKTFDKVIDLSIPMENSPEWFAGARLNYAENLLKYRDDHVALICAGEDKETEMVTYAQMYEEVKRYAAAFRKFGLKKGDRVACYLSNRKEAVFAMIAASSIGAIWTGALPLLGAQAVINRFKQIQPKILFTIDRFLNDKEEKEMLYKVKEIAEAITSLEKVIIISWKKESKQKVISDIRNSCFLDEFLAMGLEADGSVQPMEFEQVSVSHPLFISYTSGTTGLPKALIHGSGVLFTIARDYSLHSDSRRETVVLSTSPCGWASWNMFSTMHFIGKTVVLFEGVPYFLSPTYLWDMVDEFKITNLFLTPSVLDNLEKKGYLPTENNHLNSLKVIMSGSSVVKPQNYDFVYKKVKTDIIFSSAYGSTEMMGLSMTLDRTLKIHRGEITCPSLCVDVQCVDDSGNPIIGEIGELVVAKPTPSLPLGVWGDTDGSSFKRNYFEKFPGKFAVGDLAMINPVTRGIIVCGRSDDTLKPGGCRFGSSEIYNIVDTLPEVRDSICVSQYSKNGDERAVLFLKMRNDHLFNEQLVNKIRAAITRELSESHVPEAILETPEIPHNMNDKKMEIIVKKIINNMPCNPETVINPECLQNFYNVPELQGY